MRVTLANGATQKIFHGNANCPKTVLITFSGRIVNHADVYISSNLQQLQNAKTFNNNVGNASLDAGVGLFNQGNGAVETLQPIVIPGVTSDIYARWDAQSGDAFIDIEVDFM